MKRRTLIRKMMLTLALTALLLSSAFSVPTVTVSAQSGDLPQVGKVGYYYDTLVSIGIDPEELRDFFLDCLAAESTEPSGEDYIQLDLTDYEIPVINYWDVFSYLYYYLPESIVLQSKVGYDYYEDETLADLYLYYNDLLEDYQTHLAECDRVANILLKGIIGNSALSNVEKALLIHDRLATWCRYNTENTSAFANYSMYGALVNRLAVCQGYTHAYQYLLNKVGIPNYTVTSTRSYWNHAWSVVYIDGVPYHVDVTSDDPVYDAIGRVKHQFFLLSDSVLQARESQIIDGRTNQPRGTTTDYYARITEIPSDTTYDNAYWQNSNAAFQLIGGILYYMDNQNNAIKNSQGTTIAQAQFQWYVYQNGVKYYWNGNFTTMGSFYGSILYSQPDGIYRLDPTTGNTKIIFESPDSSDETKAVFGFTCFDGVFSWEVKSTPTSSTALRSGSFRMGDVNGDNKVNIQDLVRMKKLAVAAQSSFVPGFGAIDATDLAILHKVLLFQTS